MSRRILSEILQPRAEEIFHALWDEIRRAGYERSLHSGIVLCGGGALLDGMAEIAEQIFDLPIRRGCPVDVGGLTDHVNSPSFATGVGLVKYAHRNQMREHGAAGVVLGRSAVLPGVSRGCSRSFSSVLSRNGSMSESRARRPGHHRMRTRGDRWNLQR